MANRTTLNVLLTPDLEQFVSSKVTSGQCQIASEVILQGLHLLQGQEKTQQAKLDQLWTHINFGLDQAG